jgi:hypothetical protein
MTVILLCFLKGGEFMRIRHYILMVVLVGAAAFLPDHAYAEKNKGAAQSGNAHPAEVHTSVVEKVEKIDSPQKAAPAATETKRKGQKEEVQKPEVRRDRNADTKVNPVHEPGNKRHSDKAASPPTHKGEIVPVSKHSVNEDEKRQSERKNQQANLKEKKEEVSQSTEKFMPEPQREKELTFQRQQKKVNAGKKDDPISQTIKEKVSIQRKPTDEEGKSAPSEKRAIPGDVEAVNNVPQRLPSSVGGQAQETFSHGTGMVSFLHHPAVWDIGLKLRTIYHSREDTYCYQWMNAPPSPPPKAAPFI